MIYPSSVKNNKTIMAAMLSNVSKMSHVAIDYIMITMSSVGYLKRDGGKERQRER